MNLNAPGKLAALCLVIVGCMAYIIASQWTGADTTPAWGVLGSVVGYLIGNGAGARKGQPQEPVFAPPTHAD